MRSYLVLVVDDDPSICETLDWILEDLPNVTPICVRSGRQAFNQLNEAKADLILLDMKMPEMDGYEVMRQLKANPETKDIPVIAVTASETRAMVRAAGGDDHIAKPFTLDTIIGMVTKHLRLESVHCAVDKGC